MLTVGIPVALGQPEVDHENGILGKVVASNQKVVGFYVSMYDTLLMHLLNPFDLTNEKSKRLLTYHLYTYEQDRFQVKLTAARLEQIFETGPEYIHDHHMEVFPFSH